MRRAIVLFLLASVCLPTTFSGLVTSPVAACARAPRPSGRNDTRMLNAWIRSLPNGGCGWVAPRKDGSRTVYRTEGTVLVRGKSDLNLILRSAIFRASRVVGDTDPGAKKDWRQHVAIRNSTGITISGLRVKGAWNCVYRSKYEGESAFLIYESSGVTLSGVTVRGIAGDGVEIAGATGAIISGSTFDCTGRMGVSVIRTSANVLVLGSSFSRIARSVFDIELTAETYTATGIRFEGNQVASHGLLLLAGGGMGTKSDVALIGNTSTTKPIRIKYIGDNLVVSENRGARVAGNPMVQASLGSGLIVERNIQRIASPIQTKVGITYVPPIALNGWCEVLAADNDFGSPGVLFSGTPTEGCQWVDGGGND